MNKGKITENSTFSNYNEEGADVLTLKHIREAITKLDKASKQPFVSSIASKYEWWKLIEKSGDVRSFALFGGIQVVQDNDIPPNIARFVMSDGTYKDIEIFKNPPLLPPTKLVKSKKK